MRILIIAVYYLPKPKSTAKIIHDLAVEFCRLGHEAIVLTPDDTLRTGSEIACIDGVKILRVRTGKIDGSFRIFRGINERLLSPILWQQGRKFFRDNACDIVIWWSPSIFLGSLVKKLKKQFNCPSYLILRDIFPQWAIDAGILKRGLISWYFHRKELEQYEAANVIGVQSPGNLSYFRRNGLDQKYRLEVLYNWTRLKEQDIPATNYREQLGLQGKVVFFYGGNIGVAQDMDNLIRLAENMLNETQAHFLLVGEGSEVERLKGLIKKKKLTNLTIHNAVDQQKYLAMLSEFDVGLILLDRRHQTQNFPGKMLGYMYYSLPILASINPGNDLQDVLEKKSAGLVCLNGDDARFKDYAIRLTRDSKLRKQIGARARSLLESTFSVSRAAAQILANFERRKQ
ncbi:MAG: glycosyltransferase family 4 protein [bacterium]|nr:glycosyltransferase family 4 protein [bacterium]